MNFFKVLYLFQAFTQYTSGNQAYFYTSQNGDVGEQGKPNFRSLHRCSLNKDCSDIAKDKKTGELKQIKGQKEKENALKDDEVIWTKIPLIEMYPIQKENERLIAVGAKDDKFASVTVNVPRGSYTIKLIYHSGFLSCCCVEDDPSKARTKFGCWSPEKNEILIVVTDSENKILLPKGKGYSHDGHVSNSQFVLFNDVIQLHPGQQLRIWYKQDLKNNSEENNSGISKFQFVVLQN